MSYCILTGDKAISEGDTIEIKAKGVGIDPIKIEVFKIDPKSQSFVARFDEDSSEIDIPISVFGDISIIENEELSDPNILFKTRGVS